jgi:hypothetical protein
MFLLLSRLTLSAPHPQLLECTIYHGKDRLDYIESTCLEVVDCLFQDQKAESGGALLVTISDLSIESTTFFRCRAARGGGAIHHYGWRAVIFWCCFREDESGYSGNAINFGSNGDSEVWDCSFVKCKELETTSWGGIYRESNADFFLTQLNVSNSESSPSSYGVVLFCGGSPWHFLECTVVRCSGFSGLDDSGSGSPAVTSSNFYNNSLVDEGGGLFYGFIYGFDVDRCIFSGNTIEFWLAPDGSAWDGFSVTNCVFSGSLPSGDIYKAVSDNQFLTVTASFSFTYFATEFCPNPPLERTPPESVQRSAQPKATRNRPIVL